MKSLSRDKVMVLLSLRLLSRYAPVFLLFVDGISVILYNVDIYPNLYGFLVNGFGHSVGVMLYFAAVAKLNRACIYTYQAIVTMIALNILNTLPIESHYYEFYSYLIIFTGIAFVSFYIYKEWRQSYFA